MSIYKKLYHRISPEYVLLGFLYQYPGHGYELHKRLLDEFGSIWHVSQSQTYNILKRLEAQGYLSITPVEQEKLPPRQLLQLTQSGTQRFEDWLTSPTKCSVHAIRVEFISRLYFIQQCHPQKTQEIIHLQVDEVHAGLKRLTETYASLPDNQTIKRLALELRISLLSSILGWLEECSVAFGSGTTSGDAYH